MKINEFLQVTEEEKPLDRLITDGGFCGIFRTIACIGDSLSSGEFESLVEENGLHMALYVVYAARNGQGRV